MLLLSKIASFLLLMFSTNTLNQIYLKVKILIGLTSFDFTLFAQNGKKIEFDFIVEKTLGKKYSRFKVLKF